MGNSTQDRLLNLIEGSRVLQIMPRALLHSVKSAPRPNGGKKLQCKDRNGEVYFTEPWLKEFDADLRQPWVDDPKTKRPSIPQRFQEAIRFESKQRCAICSSLYSTVLAHIIDWAECLHNHPHNILLLCNRCHGGHDKEQRIPKVRLLAAKQQGMEWAMQVAVEEIMSNSANDTPHNFHDLCVMIDELLCENHILFWNFGPSSVLAKSSGDPSATAPWHNAVEDKILPNNQAIVDMLKQYRHVYRDDAEFRTLCERFIAHAHSYEAFVRSPNTSHSQMLFPEGFAKKVQEEASPNV